MPIIGCVYCTPEDRYTHEKLLIFDGMSACESCVERVAQTIREKIFEKTKIDIDAPPEE